MSSAAQLARVDRAREELRHVASFSSQLRRTWPLALLGFIGLSVGVAVIVWNEGRAVVTTRSLEEAIQSVTPLSSEEYIDKVNFDSLVYMSGVVSVQEPLTEVDYGVSILAVKLKRRVQMYQWVEEETVTTNSEGQVEDRSYHYHTEWRDKLVDSSQFLITMGHWNPKTFPIHSQTQVNENVRLGRYAMSSELKDKFSDYVEITSDERPERKDIKLHAGLYYHSHDVWNPEVGDLRIQFSYAGQHGQVVTVVARLGEGGVLGPGSTGQGFKILILRQGYFTLEDLFHLEHSNNRTLTWLYRGGGWLLLYLGFVCLSNILTGLVVRSRLLREILPTDQSSLKMTLSMISSLFITALSWMWYRPLLASSLVLVTISFLVVTKFLSGPTTQQNYHRL